MESSICEVHLLGLVGYEQAWRLQERIALQVTRGERLPSLLLLEHPHIFTFGRRGKSENLIWDETKLRHRGVEVRWVDRGGDVTYHGPGQLVGYPLVPLNPIALVDDQKGEHTGVPQADYIGYLRKLEEVLIAALGDLGITAIVIEGMTGVWVEKSEGGNKGDPVVLAKIAAIGVKVDARGITRHGFALNVNPDMSYWEGIVPCGLQGYPVTSLAELLQPTPGMQAVIAAVIKQFGAVFNLQMREAHNSGSITE